MINTYYAIFNDPISGNILHSKIESDNVENAIATEILHMDILYPENAPHNERDITCIIQVDNDEKILTLSDVKQEYTEKYGEIPTRLYPLAENPMYVMDDENENTELPEIEDSTDNMPDDVLEELDEDIDELPKENEENNP